MPELLLWRHVTLGNLINLAAVIGIGFGFYWQTTFKIAQHDDALAKVLIRMDMRDKETADFRDRLFLDLQRRSDRDIQTDIKIIERLTAVETEIKGLRADINRIDGIKRN